MLFNGNFVLKFMLVVYVICLLPIHCSDSTVRSWIVSSRNYHYTHRFFDSSPFSPGDRFLALTRFHNQYIGDSSESAAVVVIDLMNQSEHVVAATTAWGAQVGAHVQWGNTDETIFFNEIESVIDNNNVMKHTARGTMLQWRVPTKRVLPCPIYQVNIQGTYSASPGIVKIRHTQAGYGINLPNDVDNMNTNASHHDGIFVNDLKHGKCALLMSLYDLMFLARFNTDVPTYGFHVKWTSDGTKLLFVVRTLVRKQSPANSFLMGLSKSNGCKRMQHLFALNFRPPHQPVYILSWDSCGYYPYDGNHPDWIPGTHKIVMNLQKRESIKPTSRMNFFSGKQKAKWDAVAFNTDEIQSSYYSHIGVDRSIGKHFPSADTTNVDICSYNIRTFGHVLFVNSTGHISFAGGKRDSQRYALIDAYEKERSTFTDVCHNMNTPEAPHTHTQPAQPPKKILSHVHSSPNGKNRLDETQLFKRTSNKSILVATLSTLPFHNVSSDVLLSRVPDYPIGRCEVYPNHVPIRLVDTYAQREVWIQQVATTFDGKYAQKSLDPQLYNRRRRSSTKDSRKNRFSEHAANPNTEYTATLTGNRYMTTPQKLRHWRCDPHPAWNRNYSWFAVNSFVDGRRQVIVNFLGSNLFDYFL